MKKNENNKYTVDKDDIDGLLLKYENLIYKCVWTTFYRMTKNSVWEYSDIESEMKFKFLDLIEKFNNDNTMFFDHYINTNMKWHSMNVVKRINEVAPRAEKKYLNLYINDLNKHVDYDEVNEIMVMAIELATTRSNKQDYVIKVLKLYIIDGLYCNEIARMYDKSLASVCNILNRYSEKILVEYNKIKDGK